MSSDNYKLHEGVISEGACPFGTDTLWFLWACINILVLDSINRDSIHSILLPISTNSMKACMPHSFRRAALSDELAKRF